MEHRLGTIDLVSWQGRSNRRLKPGVSVWTVLLVAAALGGCVTLSGQALGLLTWTGPLAALPAGLVLLAVCSQIVAVTRAALAWLAG
jgi:hypothetical protein